MFYNPTVQSIVYNHINKCNIATAAGVVQCLIPAREKKLQKDTRLSASDARYIARKIETWVHMFHMGPPSRGYQNPSFLTNSHESCQQTGDVANTKSHDNTLPAIQGLSG